FRLRKACASVKVPPRGTVSRTEKSGLTLSKYRCARGFRTTERERVFEPTVSWSGKSLLRYVLGDRLKNSIVNQGKNQPCVSERNTEIDQKRAPGVRFAFARNRQLRTLLHQHQADNVACPISHNERGSEQWRINPRDQPRKCERDRDVHKKIV